ncbi:thaumatin family protein [Lentzea indica]|uniref:thaumatin family protein n=1 Tax=Lentzea indica TaxID=2604800 RepID=UPI00143A0735|nr:thaumatin family protein [Lentzea indica]
MRKLLRPQWIFLLLALVGALVAAPAFAAPPYSVTLVNKTGGPVWVGSVVNADGSQSIDKLPMLKVGESATVRIPLGPANHWRGKFFARQHFVGSIKAAQMRKE